MADFEAEERWETVKRSTTKMGSAEALGHQKATHCKGLAAFLLSSEARQYLDKGFKLFGVRFNSASATDVRVMKKYNPTTLYVVGINNEYGDWAVFYDPKQKKTENQ